jgi:16S rRNA (cytosine967-C5)-methyltransferase
MPKPQRGAGPRRPRPAPRRHRPAEPVRETTARGIVFARLADDAQRFPDIVPRPLDTAGLDDRDAAFAHALYDQCIRRWYTLQAVVAPRLNQPFIETETRLRAALLGGAAQLLLLDRVPPHAAISETVEWAKRAIRPGAGKLVNAVLRRVAELVGEERGYRDRWDDDRDAVPLADGRALVLAEPVLSDNPIDRLSAATSIPRTLIADWNTELGPEATRRLALHALAHAPVILNTAHAGSTVDLGTSHDEPGFRVVPPDTPGFADLLARRDDVWVQDPTSAEAVASVADLAGAIGAGLIIDTCAGKGTKTRQLARIFPDAEIIATDTDRERFAVLTRVFAGHARVRVIPYAELLDRALAQADLVLLDVPARTPACWPAPEAKYRPATRQHERLLDTQRQIVADAIRLLSPRGVRSSIPPARSSPRRTTGSGRLGLHLARLHRPASGSRCPRASRAGPRRIPRRRLLGAALAGPRIADPPAPPCRRGTGAGINSAPHEPARPAHPRLHPRPAPRGRQEGRDRRARRSAGRRGQGRDGTALKEAVWTREQTRTTGIGHGLAIPHGKCAGLSGLAMAIGKPAEPMDFEAIDGKPVRLIVLLASPPDRTSDHIQALARVSRLMTLEAFRDRSTRGGAPRRSTI